MLKAKIAAEAHFLLESERVRESLAESHADRDILTARLAALNEQLDIAIASIEAERARGVELVRERDALLKEVERSRAVLQAERADRDAQRKDDKAQAELTLTRALERERDRHSSERTVLSTTHTNAMHTIQQQLQQAALDAIASHTIYLQKQQQNDAGKRLLEDQLSQALSRLSDLERELAAARDQCRLSEEERQHMRATVETEAR